MNFATSEEGRIERRARLGVAILTEDVVAKRRQPQTNQQKGSEELGRNAAQAIQGRNDRVSDRYSVSNLAASPNRRSKMKTKKTWRMSGRYT